ncbi:MAG: ferrochelatase [Alphaproteobacteria bacterium]|nr:ferrochelatase [Alphaproteobacteria bacterium]
MPSTQKLAVVLLNLGGPSSAAAIKPFLFNFFMDKNIIPLPQPLRYGLAKWISWRRGGGAAKKSYGHLGGASPLLANTIAQAEALERALQEKSPGARVFVSMRYWHPLAEQTVQEVAAFRPDKIVLLPLYPQFSTTTSFSSLQNWQQAAKKLGLELPTTEICCYPLNAGFITASVELIRAALRKAPQKTRLLLSAHGLPERVIRRGDPYQHQCEQTAAAIVRQLDIPGLDCRLCYQSRVGRLPWIGPSIGEALQKAAADRTGVVVYPCAFVSEHVETLVEIDIEYRQRAQEMGIPYFARVPTVGAHPQFIEGLRDLVLYAPATSERTCPGRFNKCYKGAKND